jgi:hypothetical protein
MPLTRLDLLFWCSGFALNAGLLAVLIYRGRARRFSFFTALIALNVVRTILLFFVHRYSSRIAYFHMYWSLLILDTSLQLAVVYELASQVFRPLDVWAADLRKTFLASLAICVGIAGGLTWLANPPVQTWMQAFVTRGNLFAATLLSELFVAMMAFSVHAGLPWRTHVAKIAQGLGAYSLVTVLIEVGHSYFGGGSNIPVSKALSHFRMLCYLGCVMYWMNHLWREEQPVCPMSGEMWEKLFTLQAGVEYHLRDLRSRQK